MPSELLLGYNPRSGPKDDITVHILLDGIDLNAYGVHLARLDENRQQGQEQMVAAAEWQATKEEGKDQTGVTLVDGDLVLLKRFDVARSLGIKLESKWEGPYRLTELAYHGRSGRRWDLVTGELVRVRTGGLQERVHLNDLKLFLHRDPRQISASEEPFEASAIELRALERSSRWEPGKRDFSLKGK